MNFKFKGKKITGILTVVPSKEVTFEEEMANYSFSAAKSKKLALVMGYKKHRIAQPGQTSADYCMRGIQYLFDNNLLKKEDIDALLFVSQTPDYQMPPTSNVIQGHFGLSKDVVCMDINQGCAGFEVGLLQAFLLLEQETVKKVVLLNADLLSAKVSPHDRNSYPLIGDAASITVVEKSDDETPIHFILNMDGTGAFAIQIPAGGARNPHTEETAKMVADEAGNMRSLDNLVMEGDSVFNFVQREVPPMINHLLKLNNTTVNDVDWFMFHQPNKFMLNKVADAIGAPHEKMPANIVENFGNSSGVTVPMAITYNLGGQLEHETKHICIAGFGVGLTWSSSLLNIGNLDFCKMIEF
jgi:3-oxoacyl-[acyl-carrier-protein] synthase-3